MASLAGRDISKLKAKGGGKWKYMSEKDMLEMAEKFAPYRYVYYSIYSVYRKSIQKKKTCALTNAVTQERVYVVYVESRGCRYCCA